MPHQKSSAQRKRALKKARAQRYWQNNKSRLRAEQNARNARNAERARRLSAKHDHTDTTISASEFSRPNLLWLDQHGNLHAETERSAEELIAEWQKEQEKKK
jgi:hypothetical protein